MICTLDEARALKPELKEVEDALLSLQLSAAEELIRAYTGNRFHDRAALFAAEFDGEKLLGGQDLVSPGDTLELMRPAGAALMEVTKVAEEGVYLSGMPRPALYRVARVSYPAGVKAAALDLVCWKRRRLPGVKSETLSRHAVSYGDNGRFGCPAELLEPLRGWRRLRI